MLLNTLLKNIKSIVNSSVIKINNVAKSYESLDSIKSADEYIVAMQKMDNFFSYHEYYYDAVASALPAGTPEEDIELCASNPSMIDIQYRDIVLQNQRKEIIDNYIEGNQYYRTLAGLPNDESEYIILADEQLQKADITKNANIMDENGNVFVHMLSTLDIYKLETYGILDELKKNNPTYKYLNHLGGRKVDVVTARSASNFSIIYMEKNDDVADDFYDNFIRLYNQCREYFLTVIYNSEYASSYYLYDNFIGLCIMIMTIQRIVSRTFKNGIEREFFDWEFIQNMYKAYNIPFIKTLPIDYHIIILKNLNNLLRYKSTDKVLIDICSLLGYEQLDIYRYYLVRQQKMDEHEKPIFYYKQDSNGNYELDDEGNKILDYEKTFDIYFQSVNIKDKNIITAMQDITNKFDYSLITGEDPYWWEDENVYNMKYGIGIDTDGTNFNNAYNYVKTKYMGLNLMYKMSDMMFELVYAFNTILDKEDEIKNIKVSFPKIRQDTEFTLFNSIVFLISLVCKLNKIKDGYGVIVRPSLISHITNVNDGSGDKSLYAFNFDVDDIRYIKSIITDNIDIINSTDPTTSNSLLTYFENLTVTSDNNIDDIYKKIKEYNSFIIKKMRNAKTIKEYRIYKTIFYISMISDSQENTFTYSYIDENGIEQSKVADTYLEYLQHVQPILYDVVINTEQENISSLLDHVIAQIETVITSLNYSFFINGANNPIFTAVISLLNFFKSYTSDLALMNIVYLFDSKYYNMLRIFDSINGSSKIRGFNDSLQNEYSDNLYLKTTISDSSKVSFRDTCTIIR